MGVLRHKRARHLHPVPLSIIRDDRLSFAARGFLIFLMAMDADVFEEDREQWVLCKELQRAGYLQPCVSGWRLEVPA